MCSTARDKKLKLNLLFTHVVVAGFVGIVEASSVLNGDLVAGLGLVNAVAVLQNCLCDTHLEGCIGIWRNRLRTGIVDLFRVSRWVY
jgi:hypothetical protein